VRLGYPEGGGVHVVITLNDLWIGTLINGVAAESLAQFMSILAATPAENFGFTPLEEAQNAIAAGPGKPTAAPTEAP